MAQHQDLYLQRDPRLEKPDQRTPDQSAELDHQADDSPDSPPPANRIRFPTRTGIAEQLATELATARTLAATLTSRAQCSQGFIHRTSGLQQPSRHLPPRLFVKDKVVARLIAPASGL